MATIHKKVINRWNGGVKTSPRDNNPDTSNGGQVVKGFDVYKDPKKMIPMQSWTPFTTTAERDYQISSLGGLSDTIYGVGNGADNWYSKEWTHRVLITSTSTLDPYYIDMSTLPSTFWANIQSDGADLRATTSDGTTGVPIYFENLDTTAETGELWTKTSEIYLYYGNSTVSALTESDFNSFSNAPIDVWNTSSIDFAYTFPGDVLNRKVLTTEAFTSSPVFESGLFGKSIKTSLIQTDSDDEVALTGNDITISFMVYLDIAHTDTATVIDDENGTWDVGIDATNHISFFVKGDSGNSTKVSTAALSLGQWYVIDCVYNGNYYIYIDGVQEFFSDSNGDYSDNVTNNKLNVSPVDSTGSRFCKLAQITGYNTGLTQAQITSKHSNFTDNATALTIGAQEAYTSISPQYSGVQVYTKSITSGDWEELMINGQPAKSTTAFPVNGFAEIINEVYFITSSSPEQGGTLYLSKTDPLTVMDMTHLSLNTEQEVYQALPTLESADGDNVSYFTHSSPNIGSVGNPGVASERSFASGVQNLASWRTYMAVAYERRNRATIDIWDLQTTNIERVIVSTGSPRIVGTADDTLFTVVDNFIDDAVKSGNKPTFELHRYVGNGQTVADVVTEIPTVITDYDDYWEKAVSNFKLKRNGQTLFYAKLPTNATGTTFNEGLWAVGKNENVLSLTLMVDTEGLGMPENIYGFAQQIFFVQKDGGIHRLSDDTYDNTALYTSLKMNEGNTEIEKKLHGIELITEPLEAGQTVSVYFRIQGESSRTKIGDFAGVDEIAFETTYSEGEINLPHYKEIEFDIESTGGKSAILEFNYRFEYLSDIV